MAKRVYLDHNASTPVRPEAIAAVVQALGLEGNPSSVHQSGRLARALVEGAREKVAALTDTPPTNVIFTSGGTEANALALKGLGRERVLVSAIEHPSVLDAVPFAERLPVDRCGRVDPDDLEKLLKADGRPATVAIMLANNETGVLQSIVELAEVARRHGALFHTDAVQALAKTSLNFRSLRVHTMALSAHKVGGPPGCGALILADDVMLTPLICGGGQERGYRAGGENTAGIAGFSAALTAVDMNDHVRMRQLRDDMENKLRAIAPDAVIVGAEAPRLSNTCCIALPGVASDRQVIALDLAGVAVSAGAACSSGKVARSHVLAAVSRGGDFAFDISECAIRVSLGWTTTADDIERFLEAWTLLAQRRATKRVASAA